MNCFKNIFITLCNMYDIDVIFLSLFNIIVLYKVIMEKSQIEKLWNVSNSLDRMIEDLVWSSERRIGDIKKIQAMQKELDEVVEYVNDKYLIPQ